MTHLAAYIAYVIAWNIGDPTSYRQQCSEIGVPVAVQKAFAAINREVIAKYEREDRRKR